KPNLTGVPQWNYQAPVLSSTHSQGFQLRMNRNAGPRDNFYGTYAMQSARSSNPNIFGFVDKSNVLGMRTDVNWSHRFGQTFFIRNLFMTLGYQFSRQRSEVVPYFDGRTNVSGAAGITGNNQDPMNWGPPTLNFTSGIESLTDGTAL